MADGGNVACLLELGSEAAGPTDGGRDFCWRRSNCLMHSYVRARRRRPPGKLLKELYT